MARSGEHGAAPRHQREGKVITLEQFIVDTFTRVDHDGVERPVEQPDQIGGGGTYAIIGSRMFLPPTRLGMIIDYTPSTLPVTMKAALEAYGTEMWAFRERTDGHPTARAMNRYQGQTRGFQYLTEPLLLTPRSVQSTALCAPPPSVVHFISYPTPRAEGVLAEVASMRAQHGWNPLVVWEPEAEALKVLEVVARDVDVIGPNHHEVLRLFDLQPPPSATDAEHQAIYEQTCRRIAALGPKVGVVVRCGHLGACYATTPASEQEVRVDGDGKADVHWVPAYWTRSRAGWHEGGVVDPTGAGNAFMGGLAAALHHGKPLDEAVIWGTVAASFTIEQDGLPMLTIDGHGKELWNGEDPWDRVREMQIELGTDGENREHALHGQSL